MSANPIHNLDGLLSKGEPKYTEADRARLEERIAKIRFYQDKFDGEMMPALRSAARSFLKFAKEAARAAEVYATFEGCGLNIPAIDTLMMTRANLADLARGYVEAKLIDADDCVLDDIELSAEGGSTGG